MAQFDASNSLGKLTISLGLISALLFPSMSIAQPRIPVPVPPPTRSTQTLPTPLPSDEEEPAEPSEEPDKEEEEPAEPSEEPAEPEEGGGTEQIAPKYRTR